MKILAFAKINLFLIVNNKRIDGYHDIYTGITFIDIFDEMLITPSKRNSIKYTGPFAPKNKLFKDDINLKIINFFRKKEKKKFSVKLQIQKNIPPGSGLGGASADGGALIRGLKKLKLIDSPIHNTEISKIGADLPICFNSRDCIASGIGDKILFKNNFPKYYFVLVKPKFSLLTNKVYSNLNKSNYNKFQKNLFYKSKFNLSDFNNDLEKPAIKIRPLIKKLLNDLSDLDGALFSRMTGSGSCCYSVFSNYEDAKYAAIKIKTKYPNYWLKIAKNYT